MSIPRRRVIVTLIVSPLVAFVVWQNRDFVLYGPMPEREDVPRISEYISLNMPQATLKKVIDESIPWDEARIYLILEVHGKGDIFISYPSLASFTGGGRILINSIGDCELRAGPYDFASDEFSTQLPELYVNSVPELVTKYEAIHILLNEKMMCTH